MHKSSSARIFILAISALIVVAQLYIPIPLIGFFANLFAVSPTKAVWVGSAFGFAYAAGFLIFGPLSDRFGRRALLIPGLFALAIISICIGFAHSFDQIIALRIIQGFVAATFAPAALAYISEQLPVEKRALGIALVSTGFMLAGILGQIYASQINFLFGWNWIFWLAGALYILSGLSVTFVLTEQKAGEHKKPEPLLTFFHAMLKHLENLKLVKAYLCAFVLLLGFVAMYTGLGPYLTHTFNLSAADMFLIRLAGIPGMLFGPFTGIFIRKYGNRKVLIVGFLIAIIGVLLEGMLPNLPAIILMSTCFVAGVSISAPALIANISTTSATNRGAAISLYTFILFTGAALGSIMADALMVYGFKTLCLVIMGLLILSIAFFSIQLHKKQS